MTENESAERTTRSAPPSPTPQNKKQRPTNNMQMWANKTWNKMDDLERSKAVDCLTRIINDDMGLREQLEIIRILNPDAKLKPTDKQFAIGSSIYFLNRNILILIPKAVSNSLLSVQFYFIDQLAFF